MLENIGLSVRDIWSHKMRSFLTMLGIIIGIAAIISIVSTIKGTNEQIKQNLVGSGTNAVTVQLYRDDYPYDLEYESTPHGLARLAQADREALLASDSIRDVTFFNMRSYAENVFRGAKSYSGAVCGIDEHYFHVLGYQIKYGRSFLPEDMTRYKKLVILDAGAAEALFPGEYPINKTIEIGAEPFTVVGVVELSSAFTPTIKTVEDYMTYMQSSQRMTIYIPGTQWPIVYRFDELQKIAVKATSTDAMTAAGRAAEEYLNKNGEAGMPEGFRFKSENTLERAKELQEISAQTNTQLLWIAGISLLVGGIGVMNIMLVSVTERTREIGLKKAIGAGRARILGQFLTEAAVLTSLGGLLGVAAGIGLANVISYVMLTPMAVSIPAAVAAVLFSMLIGITFGLLPAIKASRLNPIDALRRE